MQPFIHTHSHTDFVQFLHPAPAEEIFKDPPPSLSFVGVGSSKWVLKIFRGGPAKGHLLQFSTGISFWHILEMIVEFITFITSCCAVMKLCNWNSRTLLNLDMIDSK